VAIYIYKRQTRPLVREGAPQTQDLDWQTVINYWLTDRQLKCDFDFDFDFDGDLTRVEVGSNTSTVTLRVVGGDEKGSIESETVKCGRESHGTRTQEWLRWRGS
jgi:hypothetical protein